MLERRTPLRRRTALAPGDPLDRRSALVRRTRLRQRSAKTEARYVERRAFVAEVLAARPRCEFRPHIETLFQSPWPKHGDVNEYLTATRYPDVRLPLRQERLVLSWPDRDVDLPPCWGVADTVHELLPRGRGGAIVPSEGCGPNAVAALCAPCHSWLHDHPTEAERLGFLHPSRERISG